MDEIKQKQHEIERKIDMLENKQDRNYELVRQKEIENINSINKLDEEVKLNIRKLQYDSEAELSHNGKIYLLANLVFYTLIIIVIYFIYRLI
jgi:hypothetical protein